MNLTLKNGTGCTFYAASMGKLFSVRYIADTDEEANQFMERNNDTGLIAQDNKGRLYIADLYGSVCPSAVLEAHRDKLKKQKKI